MITQPERIYSSVGLGWAGLAAHLYDEPAIAEQWCPPPAPMLTLGVVTAGIMHLEQRCANTRWHGRAAHPDQCFLQSYHEPYELRWRSGNTASIQTLIIKLSHADVLQAIADLTDRDPASVVFSEQIGFDDPHLLRMSQALHREIAQPSAHGPLAAQSAQHTLLVHLLRRYSNAATDVWEPVGSLSRVQLRRVRAYVRDRIAEELTLPRLAQHVNLSPYHFARLFRQATGQSPHQYVLAQRLETVKQLLRTTTEPIAHIALDCGFADQSYLTHAFKRAIGVTPRVYRERVG